MWSNIDRTFLVMGVLSIAVWTFFSMIYLAVIANALEVLAGIK